MTNIALCLFCLCFLFLMLVTKCLGTLQCTQFLYQIGANHSHNKLTKVVHVCRNNWHQLPAPNLFWLTRIDLLCLK